jgi:hypothetical protein
VALTVFGVFAGESLGERKSREYLAFDIGAALLWPITAGFRSLIGWGAVQ